MEKIKVGIFGLFRGFTYVKQFAARNDTVVYAVCDKDPERVQKVKDFLDYDVKVCNDYDELLSSGIDAVYIANYFNEHAKCAIKAMEKGIDVLSECTSAVTMKECVDLWETVERTGRKYMLAENEPYAKQNLEMSTIAHDGSLGKIVYAEGEYNHYLDEGSSHFLPGLQPTPDHWRKYTPRTYYLTHSLGPIMMMTDEWPVTVSALAVHSDSMGDSYATDSMANITCKTANGAIFRFTGWTNLPGGYAFRVVGESGLIETGRGYGNQVSLIYKDHLIPKGRHEKSIYTPEWPECDEKPGESAHGGADWWVSKGFADYILRDKYPYFDYKCGITMSIVAILAWRSVLEGGRTFEIPDFSKKEVRDLYRNDDLTPFPDESGKTMMPCASEK